MDGKVETRLIDNKRLEAIPARLFQEADPYPWLSLEGVLTQDAFDLLRANLPAIELMKPSFGRARAHGQQPHDRYALEYHEDLPVHPAWHQLVAELESNPYREWLTDLLDTPRYRLSYHWHYTPRGCSVSPHCDAWHKIGSHIFYFNTEQDWRPEWGGDTLVLDDGGKYSRRSAPAFEDFERSWSASAIGNRSMLFRRQGNSWHGVRAVNCPEGQMRKVFIVVINADNLVARARRALRKPAGY